MPSSTKSWFAILALALACVAAGAGGAWFALGKPSFPPRTAQSSQPCDASADAETLLREIAVEQSSLQSSLQHLKELRAQFLTDRKSYSAEYILRWRKTAIGEQHNLHGCLRSAEALQRRETDPLSKRFVQLALESLPTTLREAEDELKAVDALGQAEVAAAP